jgi:HEAT repeat protein
MKRLFSAQPKPVKARKPVKRAKSVGTQNLSEVTADELWQHDIEVLREAARRRLQKSSSGSLVAREPNTPFQEIAASLDSPALETRRRAVRNLYELDPDRAATLFNVALRDGSVEERREFGAALAASGLVEEAVNNLMAKSHKDCYSALSLLFLVAKAGEVQPLIKVIERQPSLELRLALIKLLASTNEPEVLPAFRRLAVSGGLATEVRLAVLEAINQLTAKDSTSSAA